MTDDPDLPELGIVSGWIRQTRKSLGLTLTDVAESARLSPSHLSRIESAEGNPSYEAVYRVYTELKRRQEKDSAATILDEKRERQGDLRFEYLTPQETAADAAVLMDEYAISQIPILEDGHAVGVVTETDLIEVTEPLDDISLSTIAGPPLPEVPVDTGWSTIRTLLQTSPAVLLTVDDSDERRPVVGQYVGLLTATDLR